MDALTVTVRLKVGAPGGDPATVFGAGTAALLRGVERTGSLNQAARSMGMAYSKAWTGVRRTEEHLGFPLLTRLGQRGSALTERGRALLECYERAVRAAEKAAEAEMGLLGL